MNGMEKGGIQFYSPFWVEWSSGWSYWRRNIIRSGQGFLLDAYFEIPASCVPCQGTTGCASVGFQGRVRARDIHLGVILTGGSEGPHTGWGCRAGNVVVDRQLTATSWDGWTWVGNESQKRKLQRDISSWRRGTEREQYLRNSARRDFSDRWSCQVAPRLLASEEGYVLVSPSAGPRVWPKFSFHS